MIISYNEDLNDQVNYLAIHLIVQFDNSCTLVTCVMYVINPPYIVNASSPPTYIMEITRSLGSTSLMFCYARFVL